jgi:Fe2+ transport system protein FeoA
MDEEERLSATRALITVIDACWRKCLKLTVEGGSGSPIPSGVESDGAFYDIQFGSLSDDADLGLNLGNVAGGVKPQAVRGAFVEMFRNAQIRGGDKPSVRDMFFSQNRGGLNVDAPFSVRWIDRAERIVEIVPLPSRLVADRRMGALTKEDGIDEIRGTVKASVGDSIRYTGKNFIRRRDATSNTDERIGFVPGATFTVSLVAKVRDPLNVRGRYHEVSIATGIEGGEGEMFLPVDPVACANINPADDATLLNGEAIQAHAQRRADKVIDALRTKRSGTHEAQGASPALSLPVAGSINQIVIEFAGKGMATLTTHVDVGGL